MRKPCVTNLDTARELLENGVVGEGVQSLVELRRCAADCGCEDWQSCDVTIQGTWREAAQKPLPEAREKPRKGDPA